jgi:GcrA cell cycle regulator
MQSNWEEAHSIALRELVEQGKTFSQIARALNARFGTAYSRNAAIGRARRMGLGCGEKASPRPSLPTKTLLRRLRKVEAGSVASLVPKAAVKLSTSQRAAALKLRCVAITPKHLALIDLEDDHCRYPYGGEADGEAITFCGHPRRAGSSYCNSHFHLTSAPELREGKPTKPRLRVVEAA